MSDELLINITPSETRVALVENGMLQEVQIERTSRRGYVGNIYKGRVSRVLPGMQAAFVDIGLERAAFLHAGDIERTSLPALAAGACETGVGISDLLREGQEVTVQVIKDPIGTKGARLTTHISIPSRFLVFMPFSRQIGVSMRIEDEAERARLKALVAEAMGEEQGHGYIVRTNAEGVDPFAIRADLNYLRKLWEQIRERAREVPPGGVIYEDLALALRALRDQMTADVDRVRVDASEGFRQVLAFAQQFVPQWAGRIERFTDDRPIFDLYGVEDDIEAALNRQVPLKSGGHLVIDQTEAMTTVDVNTGGYVGHRTLEETIFKTNLEAAQALARQLRLRNLGGIIIIDFIDMMDEEHKSQLLRTLEKALAKDHAKTYISNISPLGLVEMTRKRTTESLERLLCEPCPTCNGRGTMKTPETVSFEIYREIMRAVRQFDATQLLVLAAPAVVHRILDEDSAIVADLEEFIAKDIRFQAEEQYNQEQYDVVLL